MGYSVFPAPSSGITVADGNAAGWGNTGGDTWTVVANGTFNNTFNTLTLSGLSGYKKYVLIINGGEYAPATERRPCLRINGFTNNTYNYHKKGYNSTTFAQSWFSNGSFIRLPGGEEAYKFNLKIEFHNANLVGQKSIYSEMQFQTSGGIAKYAEIEARNPTDSQAAITSITLLEELSGSNFYAGSYTLYGGN